MIFINIHEVRKERNSSTIKVFWISLTPNTVNNFNDFPSIRREIRDIVKMAHEIGGKGFENVTKEDMEELEMDPILKRSMVSS